jgi:hypothetical protein
MRNNIELTSPTLYTYLPVYTALPQSSYTPRRKFTMQLITIVAVLTPALATVHGVALVPRGCFKGGDAWEGSQTKAVDAVDKLCHGGAGGMSGSFSQGQSKTGCLNIRDGVAAFFRVTWYGGSGPSPSSTLDDNECKSRLKNEILGCDNGGGSQVVDWYFTWVHPSQNTSIRTDKPGPTPSRAFARASRISSQDSRHQGIVCSGVGNIAAPKWISYYSKSCTLGNQGLWKKSQDVTAVMLL